MKARASPVVAMAAVLASSTVRAPWRSTSLPTAGDTTAARMPPSETAPASSERDQPNSRVIGTMNTDRVATAQAWRAKVAHMAQPAITHP